MSWTCNPPSTDLKLRPQVPAKGAGKNDDDCISNDVWQQFQTVLLEALLPYDEARSAAAEALLCLNRRLKGEQT